MNKLDYLRKKGLAPNGDFGSLYWVNINKRTKTVDRGELVIWDIETHNRSKIYKYNVSLDPKNPILWQVEIDRGYSYVENFNNRDGYGMKIYTTNQNYADQVYFAEQIKFENLGKNTKNEPETILCDYEEYLVKWLTEHDYNFKIEDGKIIIIGIFNLFELGVEYGKSFYSAPCG